MRVSKTTSYILNKKDQSTANLD